MVLLVTASLTAKWSICLVVGCSPLWSCNFPRPFWQLIWQKEITKSFLSFLVALDHLFGLHPRPALPGCVKPTISWCFSRTMAWSTASVAFHLRPVRTWGLADWIAGSGESLSSNWSLTFSFLYPRLMDCSRSCRVFLPKSAALERHRGRPSHFLWALIYLVQTVLKLSFDSWGHVLVREVGCVQPPETSHWFFRQKGDSFTIHSENDVIISGPFPDRKAVRLRWLDLNAGPS